MDTSGASLASSSVGTPMNLTNRVAVVTGAGGGIGSAICARLAGAGMRVVLGYNRREEETCALANGLPGSGHMAVRVPVDDSVALRRMAQEVAERYGGVDLLVNNAGMTRFIPHDDLEDLDDDLIDQIFRVNWRGAFACVRALRSLLAAGEGGLVVNISSIAATTAQGSNVAYCASKAALNSMTMSLARALAPSIRVISVAPGLVEGKYAASFDPGWRQEHLDKTPLGRLATGEDVADAVVAAVALLRLSTGCVIPVDGGRILS